MALTYDFNQMSCNYVRRSIAVAANSIEKQYFMAQTREAALRITLYHASSQGSMAGVINTMHCCNTPLRKQKTKHFDLQRWAKRNLHNCGSCVAHEFFCFETLRKLSCEQKSLKIVAL